MADALPAAQPAVVATGPSIRRLEHRIAAGSVSSLAALLLGIGIAIVQVPLLLQAWGEEKYGAWLLAVATYSLIVSLDMGHQNFVGNKISMLGLEKVDDCSRILGSAIKAACVIGILEFAVASTLVWSGIFTVWLPGEHAGISQLRVEAGVALLILTAFFAFFGSIGGILVRLYPPGGMYGRSVWIGIAQRLSMFIALVVAAFLGFSLAAATCIQVVAGSIVCVFTFYDLRRSFPAYWPWWRDGTLSSGVGQAGLSLGLTITSVSDQCASAGLLAIAGSHVHAAGVATLGTLRTLANSVLQAAGVVVLPLMPDLSRFAASRDHEKTVATLSTLWLISTAPLCFAVTVCSPKVVDFFSWWTRGALMFSPALFALLALSALVRQWQSPMASLLFSANCVRPQMIISATRTVTLLAALLAGFAVTRDVAVAGVAALVSEICGAGMVAVNGALFLRSLGGRLPRLSAGLAGLQIIVTAAAAVVCATEFTSVAIANGICIFLHATIAAAQWKALPDTVRRRVTSLWLPLSPYDRTQSEHV